MGLETSQPYADLRANGYSGAAVVIKVEDDHLDGLSGAFQGPVHGSPGNFQLKSAELSIEEVLETDANIVIICSETRNRIFEWRSHYVGLVGSPEENPRILEQRQFSSPE